MAKKSPENTLEAAISSLRAERSTLLSRVNEIDASFARLGIKAVAVAAAIGFKRRGRPPKALAAPAAAKPGKKRGPKPGKKTGKRRRFAISAEEAVLAMVKQAGQPNSAEVNKAWSKQGRKGKADNTLTKLVKDGALVRVIVEGERGGRYKLA